MVLSAAFVLTTAAFASAGARPCVREAKRDAKDCAAGCKETFQTAKDTCLNRLHSCVEVCRANRSQCRLDSGFDAAIDACNDVLEARRAQCRADNPPGDARDLCIDQAQIAAFQCRDAARELARPLLKQCRKDFRNCAKACPPADPADPPVDPKTCIQDANVAAKECAATCKEEYQVAKDDCRNRDHACMEDCRADRNTCREPVRAILSSDLAVCAEDRQTGVDGCAATYPPPRDPPAEVNFDQCVDGVQVDAFICRDDAHEHARPGFAICKQNFRSCVDTNCPVQP
jgi:hypothetical protein